MSIRDRIVEEANAVEGLTADPQYGDPEKYLDLVGPGETKEIRQAMLGMSGCALTVAGIWRRVGIKHAKLAPPYKNGSAVSRLISIAREVGAWVPFKNGLVPTPADMVLVGDNTQAGGVEHVYTIVAILDETIHSVDGGQRTRRLDAKTGKGFQAIYGKTRVWKKDRDIVFAGTDPGAAVAGGRKIYGWVDAAKLEGLVT